MAHGENGLEKLKPQKKQALVDKGLLNLGDFVMERSVVLLRKSG